MTEDVLHKNESAENKKDRQQKALPHFVFYRDAIHDVLTLRSISLTLYARACGGNKRKVRGYARVR